MIYKLAFSLQFLQLLGSLYANAVRLTDAQNNQYYTVFTYQVDKSGMNTIEIMKNKKGYVETWTPVKTQEPMFLKKNEIYNIEYLGELEPETYYCLKSNQSNTNNYSAAYKTNSSGELEKVSYLNMISKKMIKNNEKHNKTGDENSNSASKTLVNVFLVLIVSMFFI